uniref:Lipase domain-containing protein n=1 Tax=Heliothis virescens TaxID=7102 RepID=A0A2A4JG56_HELVI
MKFLVVLAACTALCAGNAIPLIPGDNSHYVEGESRYIWMPDGEGVPHLVDLQEPVPASAINSRNGANNQYWLFTRQNPNHAQVIVNGNVNSLRNSNYQANRGLVVLVHGWRSNGNSAMNPLIRSAFLDTQDVNVIVVDWHALAGNLIYNIAAGGVPGVGRFLGGFLEWLISNGGGNWNNVHLIGYSLGAHVVGNAGRTVGRRVGRITGLDPAGPIWGGNSDALNSNDGVYVEAIHTNGGRLGIFDRVANADFYPNGGRQQPGCSSVDYNCSHGRAYHLYASSVRYNRFVGRLCSNLNQAQNNQCTGSAHNMGNAVFSKRGSGIYGLRTNANYPFHM